MNFRDQSLACAVCGKTFIFTVTEQRQLDEAGQGAGSPDSAEIALPTQCPDCRLRDPETGRWTGRVKWYNAEKGYGFIMKPNSDEVFFHRSQVVDRALVSLDEGVAVTFEQVSTDRGAEAQNIQVGPQ